MKIIPKIIKQLFSSGPYEHLVKPEDWIVSPDWTKWTETRVVIPWDIHRGRACKFCLLHRFESKVLIQPVPWRLVQDLDKEDNLIVQYDRTNYPEEPRQGFTIQFL